jgi:hypothetical protein
VIRDAIREIAQGTPGMLDEAALGETSDLEADLTRIEGLARAAGAVGPDARLRRCMAVVRRCAGAVRGACAALLRCPR